MTHETDHPWCFTINCEHSDSVGVNVLWLKRWRGLKEAGVPAEIDWSSLLCSLWNIWGGDFGLVEVGVDYETARIEMPMSTGWLTAFSERALSAKDVPAVPEGVEVGSPLPGMTLFRLWPLAFPKHSRAELATLRKLRAALKPVARFPEASRRR